MEEKIFKPTAKTLVIHPVFPEDSRDPAHRLEEAIGLSEAIDLPFERAVLVQVRDPKPDTLIGGGKVEELSEYITNNKIELVFVDFNLSPLQQRNLEKAWNTKVIDRTGLILEIFGSRAKTREGKLQVELAALDYQKSRLVRSWTHLERQRGGFGFLGGPGETQIEMDKRMIRGRMAKIRVELETVVRTRSLHRKSRKDVPYMVVALVGYTNAGKSTLFNLLTNSGVIAEDKLFATLDPTMRLLKLPSGRKVILSDTVGFISDLPHELVAAFRATLEEVIEANILLHVRDISNPETAGQKDDVEEVLKSLKLSDELKLHSYEVYNKIDLLESPPKYELSISALTGQGIDNLLKWLDKRISEFNETKKFVIPTENGAAVAWLYEHGFVEKRKENNKSIELMVNISEENIKRYKKLYGG